MCVFKRDKDSKELEPGFAFLTVFDLSDVKFIVDMSGQVLGDYGPWDYTLVSGPMSYLDPVYLFPTTTR